MGLLILVEFREWKVLEVYGQASTRTRNGTREVNEFAHGSLRWCYVTRGG